VAVIGMAKSTGPQKVRLNTGSPYLEPPLYGRFRAYVEAEGFNPSEAVTMLLRVGLDVYDRKRKEGK